MGMAMGMEAGLAIPAWKMDFTMVMAPIVVTLRPTAMDSFQIQCHLQYIIMDLVMGPIQAVVI